MRAKKINEDIKDILKGKTKEEVQEAMDKVMKSIKINFFTVGDLKKILENTPDNLPIGVGGHFGEFCPMNKHDFHFRTARPVPINKSWRSMLDIDIPILEIRSPDLGPEPD